MSVIKPEIDSLLQKTEQNPFLLCSLASKRACDINNMLHGQHLRVTAVSRILMTLLLLQVVKILSLLL